MSEQIKNAKRLNPETIKQIHNLLDENKTIKQIMDELGVTKRQVTYQVSFRQKRQTLADMAKQAGIKYHTIFSRRKGGLSLEQALTHQKWSRYEQSTV